MSTYQAIPISDARRIGEIYGKTQVVIWTWDPVHQAQHVTTWGKNASDKLQAATAGNAVKKAAGWPAAQCQDVPVLFEAAEDLLAACIEVRKERAAALITIGYLDQEAIQRDSIIALLTAAIQKAEREVQE